MVLQQPQKGTKVHKRHSAAKPQPKSFLAANCANDANGRHHGLFEAAIRVIRAIRG